MAFLSVASHLSTSLLVPYGKDMSDVITSEVRYGSNHIIGVLGLDSVLTTYVVEKVKRRVENEGLFDAVVMVTVTNKPNYKKIQDEIAKALGMKLDDDNIGVAKKGIRWRDITWGFRKNKLNDEIESRARRFHPRMLAEDKILVILHDLCSKAKGVDLDKVGIPYGTYHTGCKLLLTSTNEDVLSNHMSAQKIFII
ncbi:hypothetical protein PIB30_041534 [Stylosanthes scabra]|uniref:NB-ARC domain-containing protein n=1 Tax=Stylosanthes scabra TaxID=79078 RepID=A0ABU6XGN8_9FABA|nr:hypothetical protein [Stylosanthes scabra]